MATDKVRVSGYVEPDLAALIAATADAVGVSRSSLVGDLLSASAPVLEVLGDVGRTLREAPGKHREALADLAAVIRPLVAAAEARADDLAAIAGGPPPSNTGVRK